MFSTDLGLAHLTALDLPPPDLIREAARAGFRSVGLRVHPALAGGVAYPIEIGAPAHRELASTLKAEGVRLNDIEFIPLTPEIAIQPLQALLEAAAALGATSLTVSGDDGDAPRLTANFAALCDLAKPYGLRVDLEFMRWRIVGNLWQAEKIVRDAGRPNGAILVDALHLHRSGGAPADLKTTPSGFVRAAQFCDAVAEIPTNDTDIIAEAREGRLPPGQGALPLADLLQALPAGTNLSVEMPASGMDARSRITTAFAATKRLLAAQPHARME